MLINDGKPKKSNFLYAFLIQTIIFLFSIVFLAFYINIFSKTYTALDQDDLFSSLVDIGDDFCKLNADSDSNSDENSDNKRDDIGINNTEVNNLHEENNEL